MHTLAILRTKISRGLVLVILFKNIRRGARPDKRLIDEAERCPFLILYGACKGNEYIHVEEGTGMTSETCWEK